MQSTSNKFFNIQTKSISVSRGFKNPIVNIEL